MAKRMGFIGSTLASLVLAFSACGGEDEPGCRRNTDCRDPQICVDGYCVDPDEGPGPSLGEGEAEAEGEDNLPTYPGMCEDYRDLLGRYRDHYDEEEIESSIGYCEESCIRPVNNPDSDDLDCGEHYRYCVSIYCSLRLGFLPRIDIDEACSRLDEINACRQEFCPEYNEQNPFTEDMLECGLE